MAKVPVTFGEWRPDLATLDNDFAADVENVFAGINSYLPVPSLVPFAGVQMPEPLLSVTSARKNDGTWQIFAGSLTKLYQWDNHGWIDVSRTTGGPYNIPVSVDNNRWGFAQFGPWLIAVATGQAPQAFNLETGGHFAALGGSPPVARYIRVIGDFVVLSGLDSDRNSIIWSGLNDTTSWTPGLNLCDTQTFPDCGPVQGLDGSEIGYVVQDRGIRTMQFLPGDTTFIFNFSRVVFDHGSISAFGHTSVANVLYFLAEEGFYELQGSQLNPIGYEKVNEWFLANSDLGRRNIVQALAANKPWIVWAYHSSVGSQMYDGLILYNWATQRWTKAKIFALAWATVATVAIDLDTDDTAEMPQDQFTEATPTPRPLDSFAYVGGRPVIAAIDQNGLLSSLTGPNLQATVESAEHHIVPGQRTFVSEVYPLADATQCVVYAGTRERLQDQVEWSDPSPLEVTGSAPLLSSSRLHRFRVVIPFADSWTHAEGVLAEAQPDGAA